MGSGHVPRAAQLHVQAISENLTKPGLVLVQGMAHFADIIGMPLEARAITNGSFLEQAEKLCAREDPQPDCAWGDVDMVDASQSDCGWDEVDMVDAPQPISSTLAAT